jgi:hypothetical protein
MAKTPVTNIDFFQIKSEFIDFLRNQEKFKDYNFEGSNMNVLLDVMAYNTYYNQFYNNMALSEMFLDSCQLRNSAISHAKELNYIPKSKQSAYATIDLTITADQAANYFTIPKNTRFTAKCGEKIFNFVTVESHLAERSQVGVNRFSVSNIKVYEGRNVEEYTNVSDLRIKSTDVDITSIQVFVEGEEYAYASDIFGVEPDDNVFYVQAEQDGYYSIYFGENSIGNQPNATDSIAIRYRITHGAEANGITSIQIANRNLNDASTIVTSLIGSSVGGRDAETLQSIKRFAPKALQIQERAVTRQDYAILLQQRFSEIQAISVFGGDEIDPPEYGSVIIAVDVAGQQGASDSEIAAFKEYLSDKTPLTIQPIFRPAQFVFVDLDISVTYDKKLTTMSAEDIRQAVGSQTIAYAEAEINGFNSLYAQSKVAKVIDNISDAILGVDINARPYIEYSPILDIVDSPEFNFGNTLYKPYAFDEDVGFTNYDPSVTSTSFTIDGIDVQLQDDGNGNLLATTVNVPTRSILKRNIGTVDYDTGKVKLSNFATSSYEGQAIKIFVRPKSKNFFSEQDRILEIKAADLNVSVAPLSQSINPGYASSTIRN